MSITRESISNSKRSSQNACCKPNSAISPPDWMHLEDGGVPLRTSAPSGPLAQRNVPCLFLLAQLRRKTQPSSRYMSGRPTSPDCQDQDCTRCWSSCRTRQQPAACFSPLEQAVQQDGSSVASRNRSSRAAEFR